MKEELYEYFDSVLDEMNGEWDFSDLQENWKTKGYTNLVSRSTYITVNERAFRSPR